MSPGVLQILVIALIVLLLFGATRLSEVGRGLGEGIRSFKKGVGDLDAKPDEPKQPSEEPKQLRTDAQESSESETSDDSAGSASGHHKPA